MLRPMTPVPMNAIESDADIVKFVGLRKRGARMQVAAPGARDTFFRADACARSSSPAPCVTVDFSPS
jgi:hypothetical protein